jgi:hypothetical protein
MRTVPWCPPLALGVALEPVAGAHSWWLAGLERLGDRADEPGVGGDALASGLALGLQLQRLGEPQGDPGRLDLVAREAERPCRRLLGRFRLVLYDDQLRVAARETDVDAAGRELSREVGRDLGEQVRPASVLLSSPSAAAEARSPWIAWTCGAICMTPSMTSQ